MKLIEERVFIDSLFVDLEWWKLSMSYYRLKRVKESTV